MAYGVSALKFEQIVTAGDLSAATVTSSTVDVREAISYCIQAVWSAGSTPVGTLSVNASLDGTTFTPVATQALSGNTGSYMLNVEKHAYLYVQLVYTKTSGSGTLVAYLNQKAN